MRRQIIILLAVLLVATVVFSQRVRVGLECSECPDPDSWTCQMWPYICENCEATCTRVPFRRVRPVPRVEPLPQTVGVAQIAYDAAWPFSPKLLNHFTTKELFDELATHGIRAVRLHLSAPYWDGVESSRADGCGNPIEGIIFEDMNEVWGHPDIDVIVLLFANDMTSNWETDCNGGNQLSWPHDQTYEFASFLFRNFGDEDKTIILTMGEVDNIWRGFHCVDPEEMIWESIPPATVNDCLETKTRAECVFDFSMIRFEWTRKEIERRQIEVERAQAENPRARLRIETSMTISVFSPEQAAGKYLGKFALRDMQFEHPPRFYGASYWNGAESHGISISDAIYSIMEYRGIPAEQVFIDQVGANESFPGKQYAVLMERITEAFSTGVTAAFVWMFRQTWHGKNKGMWQFLTTEGRVEWGEPTSGLSAIYTLNATYDRRER